MTFGFDPTNGLADVLPKANKWRHFLSEGALAATRPVFSLEFKARFQDEVWSIATYPLQENFTFSLQPRPLSRATFGLRNSAPFAFCAGFLHLWPKNQQPKNNGCDEQQQNQNRVIIHDRCLNPVNFKVTQRPQCWFGVRQTLTSWRT